MKLTWHDKKELMECFNISMTELSECFFDWHDNWQDRYEEFLDYLDDKFSGKSHLN